MRVGFVALSGSALIAALVSPGAALAADHSYMRVVGQKQGTVKGSATGARWAGMIPVLATAFEISSPRDPASGLPTGQTRYGLLTITKECDVSTPQLFQAAATNEVITSVVIQYSETSPNGEETVAHTITLGQATVAGVTQYVGHEGDPRGLPPMPLEDISFTYGSITVDGGGGTGTGRGRLLTPVKPRGVLTGLGGTSTEGQAATGASKAMHDLTRKTIGNLKG
jgi:type VI secretion system secreted protein Hcp